MQIYGIKISRQNTDDICGIFCARKINTAESTVMRGVQKSLFSVLVLIMYFSLTLNLKQGRNRSTLRQWCGLHTTLYFLRHAAGQIAQLLSYCCNAIRNDASLAGLHCHAIKNKNRNHSLFKVSQESGI